ncbi:MAG TPA: MFS transporter [Puia sp.]|nr:MFS transporter [Puia sp.]
MNRKRLNSVSANNTFRAFRSLNYSLYFIGRSVSQFGTWMQRTAVVWVVYTMTHSAFYIGLTLFAEQFPSFLLSVFGGITADRHNRFRIINITQITSMIQASLLAVLMITGHYYLWQILALSIILGVINAFDIPARQAMIHDVLHHPSDLQNAISLNSAMASMARLFGPAVSGIVLEKFGAGICFLLNAASFGAVMISLAFMKWPAFSPPATRKKVMTELVEGFHYVRQTPSVGLVILMLAFMSVLVIPYDTLLPVYAKEIFKGSADTYGYITSFAGLGAVIGTIFLASSRRGSNLKRLLIISAVILAIGLICFAYTRNFPLAMLFATMAGFGTVGQGTISNIIVQSESSPAMRGRAIGIMLMAMFGMLPLGSLIVGAVSHKIGAPATILCQGIVGLIIAFSFWSYLRKKKLKNKIQSPPLKEAEEMVMEKI